MSVSARLRELPGWARLGLAAGAVLLLAGFGDGSWLFALAGVAVLIGVGVSWYSARRSRSSLDKPWPFPPDYRAKAEALARIIDPTPQRVLPPDEKSAMIARVQTTPEGLARLMAEKPPAWQWAVFTSVLVQRRNALQRRLRKVASGYQPGSGRVELSGLDYTEVGHSALITIIDTVEQLGQFILSPAFKGTFGTDGDSADADGIADLANRLMDYHEGLLAEAETCLQTQVQPEARVFVQDVGAFTLAPLIGFDQFIRTLCSRIGEAQDLLPYTRAGGVIGLDDVPLAIEPPDGLADRIVAHIRRFRE